VGEVISTFFPDRGTAQDIIKDYKMQEKIGKSPSSDPDQHIEYLMLKGGPNAATCPLPDFFFFTHIECVAIS